MIETGDILTMVHDSVTHSGNSIHQANDRVTVLGVETEPAHYSRLCPDIWIPERVTGILLVGFAGIYFPESFYENNIGCKVAKTVLKKGEEVLNRKKFKSKNYVNTISGVIMHHELQIPAYTFEEDDSYVECRRCKILTENEIRELIK